jgi:hypothetical protein
MSGVSSGAIPAVALTALRCQGPPEYLTEFPKRPWRVFVFGRHASMSTPPGGARATRLSVHDRRSDMWRRSELCFQAATSMVRSKDVTRDMSRQCYHCLQRMQTFHL